MTDVGSTAGAGWIKAKEEADALIVSLGGDWDISQLKRLDSDVEAIGARPSETVKDKAKPALIDLSQVESMDSSGAWLVYHLHKNLAATGSTPNFRNIKPGHEALIQRIAAADERKAPPPAKPHPILASLSNIGKSVFDTAGRALEILSFFGLTVVMMGRTLIAPWRIHFKATIKHIETTGLNALPIVGLLAFLIGVVLAFQGAFQLKKFGAEIFTVDMLGVGVLRELGVLITSIVVAGRSGSAFTAQIGTMKVNQEIDAMQTLGLDPIDVLVLPRIIALMITLPLLTFYANVVALGGGGLMVILTLDVSWTAFVTQLKGAIGVNTFIVGMVKAPVFAYMIALVGCFEGLQVTGSAESVGQRTTMAVVEAIFMVIMFDALFSVVFSLVGM